MYFLLVKFDIRS